MNTDDQTPEAMWCYHPAIFRNLIPQETERSVTLIPACPCCGEGRTLSCHFKKQTDLIISSDFKDWCKCCRENMAKLADDFNARLRKP